MTEIYGLQRKYQESEERRRSEMEFLQRNQRFVSRMVAADPRTLEVLARAQKVATLDTTVLLLGETGVGKEQFARYIYENSARARQSFIGINCGAIPASLIESELFGYEKGAYSQKDKVSNLKEMNETFNYLRANGIYSLEDLEHRVSEHSAATESLKKTLDEQTARMKAIKRLYDSSAAFQSLKPVYDGLQKIKFEKPRAKYKAEHETELKQFYAARRKLTGEFPDGKVDMKKLTEEYDELEQAHNTTYGEFKTVRDDLHRLWKVKSCVDTAARFNERTEEQMLQNRPQTRHKKEDISR